LAALSDADARVRRAAVRAGERLATSAVLARWAELARAEVASTDRRTRVQVLLSLGEVGGDAASQAALDVALELLADDASHAEEHEALVSGLAGRELAFLDLLRRSPRWVEPAAGRTELIELLASSLARGGQGTSVEALLDWMVAHSTELGSRLESVARGALAGRPNDALGAPGPIHLVREPRARAGLLALGLPTLAELDAALDWPGRPGRTASTVRPLTSDELARFERGTLAYARACASCHGADGRGSGATAPRLRGSPFALGPEERLARIVLGGLTGPLRVGDASFDGDMPALIASDEEIAAILTYVRREWGHGAEPISPQSVAGVRAATADRLRPWTASELERR
jgi:mono/diheme cytochrome c family protein